jgi:hypothetical protein
MDYGRSRQHRALFCIAFLRLLIGLMILFISPVTLSAPDEPQLLSISGKIIYTESLKNFRYFIYVEQGHPGSVKLNYSPARSDFSYPGGWRALQGKEIKIDYYDKEIANCWVEGEQLCTSKCTYYKECTDMINRRDSISFAIVALFGASAAVIWVYSVFLKKSRRRR